MLKQMAALGLGLITAAAAVPAAAHDGRDPARTGSSSYRPPAPTYAPRAQLPPSTDAGYALGLRHADYNSDGGITLREAHAYGRAQFRHEDLDRNGVLTRRELRGSRDEFARGPRGDGVVTFAEYDSNVQRGFYHLDRNRDGRLSRRELGTGGPQPATAGWRRSL